MKTTAGVEKERVLALILNQLSGHNILQLSAWSMLFPGKVAMLQTTGVIVLI